MARTSEKHAIDHNGAAQAELLSLIERIERLEEEKANIVFDIKMVKTEAKSRGFDVKAIERLIKERAESAEQRRARRESEEITDVYRAALGMLDGTPLGEAARQRLSKDPEPEDGPTPEEGEAEAPVQKATLAPEDIAAAREAGKTAFTAGQKVIENPYIAGDPRRAAWDEGWCHASGSDGMDIPHAWRRSKPARPAEKPTDDTPGKGEE